MNKRQQQTPHEQLAHAAYQDRSPDGYANHLAHFAEAVRRVDAEMGWEPRRVLGTPGTMPVVVEPNNTGATQ